MKGIPRAIRQDKIVVGKRFGVKKCYKENLSYQEAMLRLKKNLVAKTKGIPWHI